MTFCLCGELPASLCSCTRVEKTPVSRVVAFTGPAGAGKSTAAAVLESRGWLLHKFAGPLKGMMREFYRSCGLDHNEIWAKLEGSQKEKPCTLLGGTSPRYAMQTLGTEWGRDLICPSLWVDAWARAAKMILGNRTGVVCDDCRFPNEVERVHSIGGIVVGISGRGGIEGGHASEAVLEPDLWITNDGPRHLLALKVELAVGLEREDG